MGWASSHKPKVTGLISGRGTTLGCGPGSQLGAYEREIIDVSLPLFLPPFPLSLKIKKENLFKKNIVDKGKRRKGSWEGNGYRI